jgi:putative phosphoesterase
LPNAQLPYKEVARMKVGIVSDTHRNKELLSTVVTWMEKNQRIAMLYHLGDDYNDVTELSDRYLEITQIPGIYDPKYLDGSLPATLTETVMGLRILLIHSIEKDMTPQMKQNSDIILHGHTHKPEMKLVDGLLYMNPGHLKSPKDKNTPASFGILDIQDKNIAATIFGIDYKVIESIKIMRSEQGLYKAL